MTRLSVALSLLVLLVPVAVPLLYRSWKSVEFRNLRVVEEGVMYRSGQMTPAGFERVCRERGIRTVIKLRETSDAKDEATDAAEEAYCRANGIVFLRREAMKWEVDPATRRVPAEDHLRRFEALIGDPVQTPRPVLIHCFAGIHRTGAVVAVYRMRYQGWTNEEAVAEMKACGTSRTTYEGNQIPFLLTYKPGEAVGTGSGGR